jgi:hypothetical protein
MGVDGTGSGSNNLSVQNVHCKSDIYVNQGIFRSYGIPSITMPADAHCSTLRKDAADDKTQSIALSLILTWFSHLFVVPPIFALNPIRSSILLDLIAIT